MGSVSIWNIEGRKMRLGITVSSQKLEILQEKRKRQSSRLLEKYKDSQAIYWKLKSRMPK